MKEEIKPGFTHDWFSEESCRKIGEWAKETLSLPEGIVLEIGAWEGKSTCALAKAVFPTSVFTIDTWEGNPDQSREMGSEHPISEYARTHDVFKQFLCNIDHFTDGNVFPMRRDFRVGLPEGFGSIRFLFFDHDHTYNMTKATFDIYLPKIVPGGIICGDDFGVPGIRQAVEEYLPGFEDHGNLFVWRKPR